jgi:hypothetical protein
MGIRNRELSQFGSFIYIDDATKTVGIATTATPYVGIGTTNATHKVTVVGNARISGDANVTGIISATSFYLNGNALVDVALQTWVPSGSDIYRLTGNVGIGTSVISEKLEIIGNAKASRFISTVTSGTSPFTVSSQTLVTNLNADYLRGKVSPSGDIVGTTDTQTLTHKTLTLPTFSSTGVTFAGSTSGVTTVRASASALGIIEIPSVTGIQTFVTTNSVGVVTSGMIADLSIVNADVASGAAIVYSKLNLTNSIVNADIAVGAAITNGKLANSAISGISLGSNLNNLTAGSFINYNSGTTYNGSSEITVSVAATTANTSNTVVCRNASGDFTAGSITGASFNATTADAFKVGGTTVIDNNRSLINVTDGNFSGIVTATDYNSTSDENLKTNIQTVQNPLDTLHQLRGVTFDWKRNNKSSVGVIAQELEKVLPQLVNEGEPRSVNYNGLIGVLIEAVKELSLRVEELENKK